MRRIRPHRRTSAGCTPGAGLFAPRPCRRLARRRRDTSGHPGPVL